MVKGLFFFIAVVIAASFGETETNGQQPFGYEVSRMLFNSDSFSEISPVIVSGGIILCSDRRFSVIKDRIGFDGHRLYNIYFEERIDSPEWEKPKILRSQRNYLFNNGPFCLTPDGKRLYLTSEIETGDPAKKKNFKNHSGIFIADLSGADLDSLYPFKYNNPGCEIGQPSISRDGKYLFFASDMPGGSGGSDLYYCELLNGEWSPPVNLGPKVNSSGNENYPYIHPSDRLYFASNRSGGIGNLDIYYSIMSNGIWEDPVLLEEPLNSASDDFSITMEDNLRKGYFSSNRHGSDDIYQFVSTITLKTSCDTMRQNSYCYRFSEENAVKLDTLPFRYEWRFGDGAHDAGVVVEHCYSGPGTYFVQLDVVNLITNEVSYNEKSDTVVVKQIEQPYFICPDSIKTGERIMLNADQTNLPGWEIDQYYWNFGDETMATGEKADKIFKKPGTYNVQLIVSSKPLPGGGISEACVSKNIVVQH